MIGVTTTEYIREGSVKNNYMQNNHSKQAILSAVRLYYRAQSIITANFDIFALEGKRDVLATAKLRHHNMLVFEQKSPAEFQFDFLC